MLTFPALASGAPGGCEVMSTRTMAPLNQI